MKTAQKFFYFHVYNFGTVKNLNVINNNGIRTQYMKL